MGVPFLLPYRFYGLIAFMLTIIQSQRTEQLLEHLLAEISQPSANIFTPYTIIVPSLVVGDWLEQHIAQRIGISSCIDTLFWGKFQWQLLKTVLDARNRQLPASEQVQVPEVAPLSVNVMQWQIFAFLLAEQSHILANPTHPLFTLLTQLIAQVEKNQPQSKHNLANQQPTDNHHATHSSEINEQLRQRLWQLAEQFARVFARYISHRPNWLIMWQQGKPLPIEQMLANKDRMAANFNANVQPTPDWLKQHYQQLHHAQMWLWQQLFTHSFAYRNTVATTFWQAMQQGYAKHSLPKTMTIFTVQQLPETELNFIKHLSLYVDIVFLHYNPSQLFWADIVDKDWLIRQRLINPQQVYLRDYGHSLLSRMGKQSREVFALLADMAGNEIDNTPLTQGDNQIHHHSKRQFTISWHDDFVDTTANHSLLAQLQHDILMLEENHSQQQAQNLATQTWQQLYQQFYHQQTAKHYQPNRHWQINLNDNSLRIHSCHSLQRQLEVLRGEIIHWLNQPPDKTADKKQLADILILLPNLEQHQNIVQAVFPDGVGTDGYHLPARLTGVAPNSVSHLWQAIIGFYQLSHQRFNAQQVFDWLMLPELHQTYGLSYEQMQRGCDLLVQAGFIRGINEAHLQQGLHPNDTDTRFCFSYALDRLVIGLLMPQAPYFASSTHLIPLALTQTTQLTYIVPLNSIQLADAAIVSALCELYADICKLQPLYLQHNTAYFWLENIESFIHHRFATFNQTTALTAVWQAINSFKQSLRAMRLAQQHRQHPSQTTTPLGLTSQQLPLAFILTSIGQALASQQTSSEPAGVITIARFGTIRPLPYRIIAMVNMNMGDFPSREQDNRYDLTQADVPKRGDRFKEDDDLGAFLDALLCAREACWLFFNGASLTDPHQHLPANPVQELIAFLTDEVNWQANSIPPTFEATNLPTRQLIYDWLVTEHPALPFHPDNFVVNPHTLTPKQQLHNAIRTPPAKVWQKLYIAMQQPKHTPYFVDLPTSDELHQLRQLNPVAQTTTPPLVLNAKHWIQDLQQPARHYLLSQHISPLHTKTALATLEPLILSPLTAYQIHRALLTELHDHLPTSATTLTTQLAINHLLPAGVGKTLSLQQQQQLLTFNLNQLFNQAKRYLKQHGITVTHNLIQNLTHIGEYAVKIGKITVNCSLPQPLKTHLWLNAVPHKNKAKHLLSFWLQHLLWQISRQTTPQDVSQHNGTSIWRFNKNDNACIAILPPISQQQAQHYLQQWFAIWFFNQQQPLILPVSLAFNYASYVIEKNATPENLHNIKGFSDWLTPSFGAHYIDEDCSQHDTWQLILTGQNPSQAVAPTLELLATHLYAPLIEHLTYG